MKRKKIGLALSTGGVRGMAHVGVLKVLCKAGIPVDYIAGTSVGAWVGAYYAKTLSIEQLEETTLGYKKEKLRALFEPAMSGGIVRGVRIEALLRQLIGNPTFDQLNIPLTVVATSLTTGEERHINKGRVVSALRSSTAIPLVFKPVSYKKDLLVDGGLSNPLPTDVVRAMGADIVIAVNLDGYLRRTHSIKSDKRTMVKTALQSFDLMRYHLAEKNARLADIVIEPHFAMNTFRGWQGYFWENREKEFMNAGETAAKSKLRSIKRHVDNK